MALFPNFLQHILSLSLWLAILTVIFVPMERFFAVYSHKTLRKGIGIDVCYYFINSLLPAALLSVPVALLAWSVRHFVPESVLARTASLPFWALISVGLVVSEIGGYWGHRWSHEIPFLWRFHAIHHSAEDMDFLVNTRAHPLDMVFGRFCALAPLVILGLAGPARASGGNMSAVLVLLVGTFWGFFVHANVRWRLGPLEWLVATPKFHHWHHTKTGLIDRNYAAMLPWIDRLFSTHHLPNEWPASYGVEAPMPHRLMDQMIYPLMPPDFVAGERSAEAAAQQE